MKNPERRSFIEIPRAAVHRVYAKRFIQVGVASILVFMSNAEALAVESTGDTRPPPPCLVRLSDRQIKHALKNVTIIPNRSITPSAFQFSETFEKGGKWSNARAGRQLTNDTGRWWIEYNQLCVETRPFKIGCRIVYIDKSTRSLMMEDMEAMQPDGVGGGLIAFTIKRLESSR